MVSDPTQLHAVMQSESHASLIERRLSDRLF